MRRRLSSLAMVLSMAMVAAACSSGSGDATTTTTTTANTGADTTPAPAMTVTAYAMTMEELMNEKLDLRASVRTAREAPDVSSTETAALYRVEADALDVIRSQMQAVTPPPEYETAHELLVEAAIREAHGNRLIADGIDMDDTALLEEGLRVLVEVRDMMLEADSLLTTLVPREG